MSTCSITSSSCNERATAAAVSRNASAWLRWARSWASSLTRSSTSRLSVWLARDNSEVRSRTRSSRSSRVLCSSASASILDVMSVNVPRVPTTLPSKSVSGTLLVSTQITRPPAMRTCSRKPMSGSPVSMTMRS